MDHNCKILGKASADELSNLIAVRGISPGTLLIGEPLQTEDGSQEPVDYLTEILSQIQDRGLSSRVTVVELSDNMQAQLQYGGRLTVQLGGNTGTEHKFGMFVAVLDKLSDEDVGYLDLSDGQTAHFMSE